MPLYEYHCNDCGDDFEKMVRFSEAGLNPACPTCKGQDTKKKISAVASLSTSLGGGSFSTSSSSCGSRGGFS
jgi:putative FmdB family regulatory protein